MNKKTISTVAKNLGGKISRNSPTILTVAGIAGLVGTVIFAVKDTVNALRVIEDAEHEREFMTNETIEIEPLSKVDIIKLTWKCYIPTACLGAATILCIIGSNSINSRRIEALGAVYGFTERAFREYKGKVIETIGERKEKKVRESLEEDRIARNPVSNHQVIFTDKGNTLCYDPISARYFRSDIELIRKTENILNKQLFKDTYVPLNDFYYELGLRNTSQGNQIGWSATDGFIDISFTSHLADDNTPCLALQYVVAPKYDYQKR